MRSLIQVLFLFLFLVHGQCSEDDLSETAPTSDKSPVDHEDSESFEEETEELSDSASNIESALDQPEPPPLKPSSTRRPNDRRKARDRRHKAACKLRKKKGRRSRHHAPKGPRLRRLQRIRRRNKAKAKRRGKKLDFN